MSAKPVAVVCCDFREDQTEVRLTCLGLVNCDQLESPTADIELVYPVELWAKNRANRTIRQNVPREFIHILEVNTDLAHLEENIPKLLLRALDIQVRRNRQLNERVRRLQRAPEAVS